MAQPVLVAPSKLRIKLKGVTKQHGTSTILKGGSKAPSSTSAQLQELHSAVEAFCRQGINSLPGAVLLSPWREEPPLDQQWSNLAPVADSGQQLVPGQRRRVRRRRPAAAVEQDARDIRWQLLQWSRVRRRRSSVPARVPRAAAQLSNSMCLMQGKAPWAMAFQDRPAAIAEGPAARAAALQQHQPPQQPQRQQLLQHATVPQQPQPAPQPKQQAAITLKQHAKPQQAGKQRQASAKQVVQPVAKSKGLPRQQVPEPQAATPHEQQQLPANQASEQRSSSQASGQQQLQQQRQKPQEQGAKVVQKQRAVAPSIPQSTEGEPASSKVRLRGQAAGMAVQQQQQEHAPQQDALQQKQTAKKQKQAAQPEGGLPAKQQRPSLQAASPGAAAKAAAPAAAATETATAATAAPATMPPATAAPAKAAKAEAPAEAAAASSDGKSMPAASVEPVQPAVPVDAAAQAPADAAPPEPVVASSSPAAIAPAATASETKAAETSTVAKEPAPAKDESPAAAVAAAAALPEPAPPEPAAEAALAPAAGLNAGSAAAAAAVKPESPPSETSHQQPMATAAPQHVQQLQQPLPPQLPQEQTAVSRDRSQCSLQQQQQPAESPAAVGSGAGVVCAVAAAHAASAAAAGSALSSPAVPAAVPAAAAAAAATRAPKQHLLELAPAAMTPAARALAALRVPEVQFKSLPPADKQPVRNQDEALEYVRSLMGAARSRKHLGDERAKETGHDVLVLNYYAMSTLMFLEYIDTAQKLARQLAVARQPMEKLQHHINQQLGGGFLKQVGGLCTAALQMASNCRGPDVVKQALRMLLERLGAICQMRHLHSQRETLLAHVRLLKTSGSVSGSSAVASSSHQQQQQVQRVASGKPPSHSSSSPHGQQGFNKRSPDDSNTSNQDRVQLPGMGQPDQHSPGRLPGVSPPGAGAGGAMGVGAAGGGQEHDLQCAKAEAALVECMNELLRVTDGMHQTVMRMQQFLESPEVLASEQARTAALHISTLGLDAGMYSIPRVVAHSEAALASLLQYTRLMNRQ